MEIYYRKLYRSLSAIIFKHFAYIFSYICFFMSVRARSGHYFFDYILKVDDPGS